MRHNKKGKLYPIRKLVTGGETDPRKKKKPDNSVPTLQQGISASQVPGFRLADDEIAEQREFHLDQFESPKFRERLTKEVLRDTKGQGFSNRDIQRSVDTRIENRKKAFTEGQTFLTDSPVFEIEAETEGLGRGRRLSGAFRQGAGLNESIIGNSGKGISVGTTQSGERILTTPVHELTHQSTAGNNQLLPSTKGILDRMAKANRGKVEIEGDYINNPSEVHARINETRFFLKKDGVYDSNTEDFTLDHVRYILDNIERMPSGVQQLFRNKTPEQIFYLMNNIAQRNGAPVTPSNNQDQFNDLPFSSLSSIKVARKGGVLGEKEQRSYKSGGAVVLGGSSHDAGGNAIIDSKTQMKVAETESEELLLNYSQTKRINKHVGLFDSTQDDIHFAHLGKMMKEIIDNQTTDNSGKYPELGDIKLV